MLTNIPFGRTRTILALFGRAARGPVVVGLLILGSLALGYVGYQKIPGEQLNVGDALYRSLQLFNVDAQLPDTGVPWELEVARFLAPLAIAYAALVAVFALAREQVQRWRTKWFARKHIVVIGLGARGSTLAKNLRDAGQRVVALERDRANGSATSLRETGVGVIVGDATDPEALSDVRIGRATHVVIVAGGDSTNLDVLASCRQAIDPNHPVPTHVAIEQTALWMELHRLPLAKTEAQRRAEFVNLPDRIATALVEAVAPVDRTHQQVLLAGCGPTVVRVITHLLRSTVVDSTAEFAIDAQDWQNQQADLAVYAPDLVDSGRLQEVPASGYRRAGATLAIVCGVGEAEGLSKAAEIAACMPGAQVVVEVADAKAREALESTRLDVSRITLVPARQSALGTDLLEHSAAEVIARAKHDDYKRQLESRGETVAGNPSLVPWDQLPESLRVSNRRFADGIAAHLAAMGAALVPASVDRDAESVLVPPGHLEQLAIAEHDRWVADLKLDGWSYGAGDKDPVKRIHPLLVPWEDLSEEDREKDRDAIKAIPELLRKVGYEIRLPSTEVAT